MWSRAGGVPPFRRLWRHRTGSDVIANRLSRSPEGLGTPPRSFKEIGPQMRPCIVIIRTHRQTDRQTHNFTLIWARVRTWAEAREAMLPGVTDFDVVTKTIESKFISNLCWHVFRMNERLVQFCVLCLLSLFSLFIYWLLGRVGVRCGV